MVLQYMQPAMWKRNHQNHETATSQDGCGRRICFRSSASKRTDKTSPRLDRGSRNAEEYSSICTYNTSKENERESYIVLRVRPNLAGYTAGVLRQTNSALHPAHNTWTHRRRNCCKKHKEGVTARKQTLSLT